MEGSDVGALEYPTSEETSPSLAAVVSMVDLDVLEFRGQTSPDGTMTVVFTDVVASTEMLERLGEKRWLEVMRHHNVVVRELVAAHEGLVVKSQGDGFMIIFASASVALNCAVELEKAFASYGARDPELAVMVRIGLHTGNVYKERSDFLGRTVIVAARITGHAGGGEVLVSALTKDYTEHLGLWRFGRPLDLSLKGLSAKQRVYPLEWDDPPQAP